MASDIKNYDENEIALMKVGELLSEAVLENEEGCRRYGTALAMICNLQKYYDKHGTLKINVEGETQ